MANKDEKMVTTPKDKKLEDLAVRYKTEILLMGDKTPSKTKMELDYEKALNRVLDQLTGTTKDGEGRQRILSVIEQKAANKVKKEMGEKVTSPIEPPKSPPDKSLKELFKERLAKGRGSDKSPSVGEAIVAGASAIKSKIMGDDKRKIYDAKGGLAKPKMMGGGMAYGKKHMYVAGGSVTENRKKK